jgi:cytochrome c-type biogenesis protein CcmE
VDEELEGEEVPETEMETGDKKARSGFTGKKKKILTAVAVLVIISLALVVGLWGNAPVPYMTVSEVTNHSSSYLNKEIEIKGIVKNWNTTARTFEMTDEESRLVVSYDNIPDGFNNEKEIVVSGILTGANGLVLEAEEITVGCPSKY